MSLLYGRVVGELVHTSERLRREVDGDRAAVGIVYGRAEFREVLGRRRDPGLLLGRDEGGSELVISLGSSLYSRSNASRKPPLLRETPSTGARFTFMPTPARLWPEPSCPPGRQP